MAYIVLTSAINSYLNYELFSNKYFFTVSFERSQIGTSSFHLQFLVINRNLEHRRSGTLQILSTSPVYNLLKSSACCT